MSGSIQVQLRSDGTKTTFVILGEYPGAKPDQYLKYDLWLSRDGSDPIFMAGRTQSLKPTINDANLHYEHASNYHPELIGTPVQAILDYEIWQGEPDRGKLLTKSSVFSAPHVIKLDATSPVVAGGQ